MSQQKSRTKSRVATRPNDSLKSTGASQFISMRADVARKGSTGSGAFFTVGGGRQLKVGRPGSPLELAADAAADRVVSGQPVEPMTGTRERALQTESEEELQTQIEEEEEPIQAQEQEEEKLQMQEQEEEKLQMQEAGRGGAPNAGRGRGRGTPADPTSVTPSYAGVRPGRRRRRQQ